VHRKPPKSCEFGVTELSSIRRLYQSLLSELFDELLTRHRPLFKWSKPRCHGRLVAAVGRVPGDGCFAAFYKVVISTKKIPAPD
jgi:hypothetical protein